MSRVKLLMNSLINIGNLADTTVSFSRYLPNHLGIMKAR